MFLKKKTETSEDFYNKSFIKNVCQEYDERFPQLGNTIFYYNDEPLYISTELKSSLTKKQQKHILRAGKNKNKYIKKTLAGAHVTDSFELPDLDDAINTIIIKSDRVSKEDASWMINSIDHEFGHLLTKTKPLKDCKDECEAEADVFALLMNIKRFGKDTITYKEGPYIHCTNIFSETGSPFHYTTNALLAVHKFCSEVDVHKLSSKELIETSRVIAEKTSIDNDKLQSMKRTFTRRKLPFNDVSKSIATVILEHNYNEPFYRAGKLFLSYYNSKRPRTKDSFNFWAKIDSEMKKHEEETGFILNPIEALEARENIDFVEEVKKDVKKRMKATL